MKRDNQYLIDVRNKSMVVKANELIQKSRFSLSLQQQKIVLYLISQVNPFDEDFKLYEFSIPDFCRVCGIDFRSGKHYADLKKQIKEIADKSLWVRLENGKETLLRWIEKPYVDEKSGTIAIRLDRDMKPFLLELKGNYTRYQLLWTLNFRSKYSIRLFELVCSIHYCDLEPYTKEYEIEELKQLLDAESYEWEKLKTRVLEQAIKEINEYSDKIVSYEPIKRGRKVVRVALTVESKEIMERLKVEQEIKEKYNLYQISLWDET